MSSVSESNLEKKFQHVTNTQDSIQSFSLWIIHHKSHCKKIVEVWIKILRKTKVTHRLTLLYLANDVIQNAKRKGAAQFAETFFTVLPEATVLLRDDKIRGSVERVFNIWENRNIFSTEAIEELKGILHNTEEKNNATTKLISEFKPEVLTEKIRKTVKLQLETTSKLSALNASKLDAANSEVLRQFKDRSHGQQFSKDFEEATRCLEEYIGALEREVAESALTIQLLEQAVVYYDTQRGEARIVANAYKSFSSRITAQQKKLEGLKALLPSPFPSPCADAPSPSNSDEGLEELAPVALPTVALEADDAPSPVGTPEGLQLTPKVEENTTAEVNMNTEEEEEFKLTPPVISSSTSLPVTSFLGSQGVGLMTSWLDALKNPIQKEETESQPLIESKPEDSLDSRLDSRLLNFMQSMPSSVPSALLAGVGGDTPVKDEWASGQGTPVQDEDEPPQNDLLKQLARYGTDSPSQTQWPSVLPPNPISISLSPLHEEPVEIKPLLPPPKPSFLSFLSSPPSASSALTSNKSKSDPRHSSQNFSPTLNSVLSSLITSSPTETPATSTPSRHTGKDDNEPMDMDIGESDDEDEHKSSKLDTNSSEFATTLSDDIPATNHTLDKDVLPVEELEDDLDKLAKELPKHADIMDATEKPTTYSTYHHYSFNRLSENDTNGNRLPESKLLEDTAVEDNPDDRINSDRSSDSMQPESKHPEGQSREMEISDSRLSESKMPESTGIDSRLSDSRSDDSRFPDVLPEDRMPESIMVNNRPPEASRIPEGRMMDSRLPENNKTGGMWKPDGMECSRIETIQTVRNDSWRSPTWDDGPPPNYNYRPPPHQMYRPHMQHHYDDRRQYDRPYNEVGYGRGYPPQTVGGPKRFQAPFGGRGGRGYFVPRY